MATHNVEQLRADFEAWYREKYNSTLYCEARYEGWVEGRAALQSQPADTLWQPISAAPVNVRVLLGPRHAPVVGVVRIYEDADSGSLDRVCSVVHYNGSVLVAHYRCSEWAPIPNALQSQDREDAERYRLLRRGQKWSVIDGIGDELRAEGLDAAIDHARRVEGGGE